MPFAPVQGITLVPQFRARRSLASLSPGAFVKGRLVGNAKCGSSWLSIDPLFELAWTLYYLPCYTLVTITTLLLKVFPSGVPGVVNSLLGVVLTFVASVWIIPLGLLGTVTAPLRIFWKGPSTY